MITIKNFKIVEEHDEFDNDQEYQTKCAVFNHLMSAIDFLFSAKNPNFVQHEGQDPAINRNDTMALVTEVIHSISSNFDITVKPSDSNATPKPLTQFADDWRGFVALTSIRNTYSDMIISDDETNEASN